MQTDNEIVITDEGDAPPSKIAKLIPAGEEKKHKARFVHEKIARNKPILTIETLTDLLARLNVSVKYNVITKDLEITVPNLDSSPENSWGVNYGWLLSQIKSVGMDTYALDDFLLNIGEANRYNAAAEWVTSKPWDETPRFAELYNTIECERPEARDAFIYRWLITCIAALFEPRGITSAGMLVLQGDQGLGKTWWFRKLFPDDIRSQVFKDSLNLVPHDRDSVKKCVRNWVGELGELDGTFRRADLAALDAFITSDSDTIRLPYGRREKTLPRRTVFGATVNNAYFLCNPNGNRRFWTIACTKVNSYHDIDMQQVWAEAYHYYNHGEKWQLNQVERAIVAEINQEHEMFDFASEKVKYFYDWDLPLTDWKSSSEIVDEMGFKNPTRSDLTSVGIVVLRLNNYMRHKSGNRRVLKVPPRRIVGGIKYTQD